jgi:hypothetical protein
MNSEGECRAQAENGAAGGGRLRFADGDHLSMASPASRMPPS